MSNPEFIPAAKPDIGSEEKKAVARVLDSGMIAQGPEVEHFEEEFSKIALKGVQGLAVNSGTSALHLGVLASELSPGAEVIVPSFTFAATANAVAAAGARPVFADVDEYFTLDPKDVEDKISPRTEAIMPVHLYGHPANMSELQSLAVRHGLKLFEDCAQAHLAEWDNQPVGTFGDFGAFSFYPTKNMTTGEGGFVSSRDPEIRRRVSLLRNQGMEIRYQNELIGFNNRMTDIHAAIGRVQLQRLPEWTRKRQQNADYLSRHLMGVQTPLVHEKATHVYHQYTILIDDDRDGFQRALKEEYAIGSGVYYPTPNHQLPSLVEHAPASNLANTARLAETCLSLPVYPSLSREELDRIVEAVNTLAQAGA